VAEEKFKKRGEIPKKFGAISTVKITSPKSRKTTFKAPNPQSQPLNPNAKPLANT